MHATEYFKRLFAREIPVVVDNPEYIASLKGRGFEVLEYGEVDFRERRDPCFVLFTRSASHEEFLQLWDEVPAITAHLSLTKFDLTPETIEYSIDQFLGIDFAATLERRAAFYDSLLSCDNVEVVPPQGPLMCAMGEEVELADRADEMTPGFLYSVSEFLEASVVNLAADRSSFILDGEFAFDGLIYLCNNPGLRAEVGELFKEWVRLASKGSNSATFVNNAITRFVLGGVDVTQRLLEVTGGKERGSSATEFAFGCVDYELESQEWWRNSVMHESFHGIHVGIGMGQQIPHFDLIARGAAARFITEPRPDEAAS